MLAPSPLLSQLFIQAIAFFTSSLFDTTPRCHLRSSIYTSITLPLAFCSEKIGALYNSVMLYYWFIVACSLGLFSFLRPRRQLRLTSSPTLSTKHFRPKTPPPPNYKRIRLLFFIYMLLISVQVYAMTQEHLSLQSLYAIPFAFSCGSLIISYRWQLQAINKLLSSMRSTIYK
jgi:hypothetical protein